MLNISNLDAALQNMSATGYIAALATIFAFYSVDMKAMRIFAVVANIMFIAYAAANTLYPILILHVILLPINFFRLMQIYNVAWKQKQVRL